MFPSNQWDALARTLAEIDEVMVQVGKVETVTIACAVCSAILFFYFFCKYAIADIHKSIVRKNNARHLARIPSDKYERALYALENCAKELSRYEPK